MSKKENYPFFVRAFYRSYQTVYRVASYFLIWREPEVLEGKDSIKRIPLILQKKKKKVALIVTDERICQLGLIDDLLSAFKEVNMSYVLYNKTVPNPTFDNVEEAYIMYKENHCDCLVAMGGGSPMDCAKGVGIRVARPRTPLLKMNGIEKVLKRIPFLVAVPTTAGTGSEATIAAVLTDAKTKAKYPISDLVLLPRLAILDPTLTVGLPPLITATTGLDALTHAVEAFIGRSNTKKTKAYAKEAIGIIDQYLVRAYTQPDDLEAREKMLYAAMRAGMAFTRAYVGYVHAIAHALGGLYGIPHGLANSVLLPVVLESYGDAIYYPLSQLSDSLQLAVGKTEQEKAEAFIRYVREINKKLDIPTGFTQIKEEDIEKIRKRALEEAHPIYPVPRLLGPKEIEDIIRQVKQEEE
ncbi:MAG: iron-containing alcohol dehydrogenase [Anaerorhabdus sp.]